MATPDFEKHRLRTFAKKLAEMFRENMKKFGSAVSEKILAAGPKG